MYGNLSKNVVSICTCINMSVSSPQVTSDHDLLQVMDLMGQAMEQFGLMMCCVEVVRKVCPSVFTVAGESIIVTTMKMPQ